jgi:hypothetical protein
VIKNTAKQLNRKIYTASTGFMDKGKDIGSGEVNFLKAPKIAVLFGEQTSSLSVVRSGIFSNSNFIIPSHNWEQNISKAST